jgi:translation initiation factor 2B subunit (eIF-2B alpha/beta/delta family)
MQKVSKVIVNCYALMQDGGILGNSGMLGMAMVAKDFSVPFLVVSGIFKLTPHYAFGQETYNSLLNPA